jgi:hypothetical protein
VPPGLTPPFAAMAVEVSAGTTANDSATAIAASAANVSFCILGQELKGMCSIKYLFEIYKSFCYNWIFS